MKLNLAQGQEVWALADLSDVSAKTGSGATAITTAIGANVVTNGMFAQIATARFKGRTTAGTGNVEDLTGAQASEECEAGIVGERLRRAALAMAARETLW